jgi:cholesterol oxidase
MSGEIASNDDYDWIVIGSGFGGSVAALRLAEKGYRVAVLESGRRFRDGDFSASSWDLRRFFWAPALGLNGISRVSLFKDILIGSGAGVGGGSLLYANTLYRARSAFFLNPQWAALADWEAVLAPHYATAEHMLGVRTVPWESESQSLLKAMAGHFGADHTFRRTPCAVFFGAEGVTVPDPYFDGTGPERTGCIRCGACTTGCNVGAKNTLVKNYLWFAEKLGVVIRAQTHVVDIRPLDAGLGATGYEVLTQRSGAWFDKHRRSLRARGVVVAAGSLGTNQLLAGCKHVGGLPRLSGQLGELVRTNSESILAVTLPDDSRAVTRDVSISASIHVTHDTHIELVSYGRHASYMKFFFTLLTGNGTRRTRPLLLALQILRHPLRFLKSLSPLHWSRRSVILLVMQPLDNAIRFVARRRWFGRGVRLCTEQNAEKPNPTFIAEGNAAAAWLAAHTGGIAQSMLPEALANIPTTAHILGGAVIGSDANHGVVDSQGRVFGYANLLICDGAIMPANPGVNPSLTITALAEHVMSSVPHQADRNE